jgi:hypothetical protein
LGEKCDKVDKVDKVEMDFEDTSDEVIPRNMENASAKE